MKTYIIPHVIIATYRPASLFAVSNVQSGGAGISGGGGASSSEGQRSRRYDDWAAPGWAPFGEE